MAPTDAANDAARRCFNALVDRRPAVIVRCLDAGDVATAFDFARSRALEVARGRWRWRCAEAGTTSPDTASWTAGS